MSASGGVTCLFCDGVVSVGHAHVEPLGPGGFARVRVPAKGCGYDTPDKEGSRVCVVWTVMTDWVVVVCMSLMLE